MLKAILHGKAGRVEIDGKESVRWAYLFKAYEDLLTSTFFERFAYLSESIQIEILAHCIGEEPSELQANLGKFKTIDYWPRFNLSDNDSSRTVEPDLVIRFSLCNLIIEVKPPSGGDQYVSQWNKEIASFLQSDEDNDLPLYFLAIGKIRNKDAMIWAKELMDSYQELNKVSAIKWQKLSDYIVLQLEGKKLIPTDRRVLNDTLAGFALYGLNTSPFKWEDFNVDLMPYLSLHHSPLVIWPREDNE